MTTESQPLPQLTGQMVDNDDVRIKIMPDGETHIEAPDYAGPCRRENRSERRDQLTFFSLRQLSTKRERRTHRRAEDRERPYVDWYQPHLMAVAVAIFVLACADAFMTAKLWLAGAATVNPVIANVLSMDLGTYINLKIALTGFAVLLLVIYKDFRVYRIFRVSHVLYVLTGVYSILVANQLWVWLNL